MIKKEEVFILGQILKPHGIKGELTFSFTTEVFDEKECPYFIVETEGILVPFFIESYRLRNNQTGLVLFEGIHNEQQARELNGCTIYLPLSYYQESDEETDINYYIGFIVADIRNGIIGKIKDVDDSTENVLFIVDYKGEELLIPAVDEFIDDIDHKKRILYMQLPTGLIHPEEADEE